MIVFLSSQLALDTSHSMWSPLSAALFHSHLGSQHPQPSSALGLLCPSQPQFSSAFDLHRCHIPTYQVGISVHTLQEVFPYGGRRIRCFGHCCDENNVRTERADAGSWLESLVHHGEEGTEVA